MCVGATGILSRGKGCHQISHNHSSIRKNYLMPVSILGLRRPDLEEYFSSAIFKHHLENFVTCVPGSDQVLINYFNMVKELNAFGH